MVSSAATGRAVLLSDLLFGHFDKVPAIYISADKGGDSVVINLMFWCDAKHTVETVTISVDECDGTAAGIAYSILYACRRCAVDTRKGKNDIVLIKLYGQMTDSGGGGNIEALETALHELDTTEYHGQKLLTDPSEYLVGNCNQHNVSNFFAYPFKQCFGEGGLDKRNPLQCLHSVWDLQEKLKKRIWHKIWNLTLDDSTLTTEEKEKLRNNESHTFPQPVLTRWCHVSDSIHKITASGAWKVLTKVCEGIVNSYPTANALNKIASGLFANLRVELNHVYIT
jgi:hypothetical protein